MFADDLDVGIKVSDKNGQVTDDQGYYQIYSEKLVGKKYQIIDKIGKGVFGIVAKAVNIEQKLEVALKILRKNEAYVASG